MLNPISSEAGAFRLAIGSAVTGAASIALGVLTSPLYGLALFASAAGGAFAYFLTARDPDRAKPLGDAAHAPHPAAPRARHRILVIADEALDVPVTRVVVDPKHHAVEIGV